MSRSCFGLVLVFVSLLSRCYFGDISVMFRLYFGRETVSIFFCDISVIFWCCVVGNLVVFWDSFSNVLATFRACFGEVSVMFGDGGVIFWNCIFDVAVLIFFFSPPIW